MKKFSFIALLAFGITAVYAVGVGEKLGGFSSPEWLDGKTRTLKEVTADKKFTVLYLWQPDQNSLLDFPRIAAASENFRKDAAFAGVGFADAEKLKRFPGAIRLGFPVNADKQLALLDVLKLKEHRLPLAVVLDKNGTVLWRGRTTALPGVLTDCIGGTFDLQEEIRRTQFAQAVNAAVKAKDFEKALKMMHAEWLKKPAGMELLNAQIAILTRKLNRPEAALTLIHEAQQKNPGNHRMYEAEYKLLADPKMEKKIPEFFTRVKKEFAGQPGILMAFAMAEMGRPSDSLDMMRVLSLADAGWRSKGFNNDLERGLFALEYAKIVHSAGRTDLAVKLTQMAYPLLKKDPKRQELAKKAALYYGKLMLAAPSIKIPDLKK